jgi:hypothetical protein
LLVHAIFNYSLLRFGLPKWAFVAILAQLLTLSIMNFNGSWFDSTLAWATWKREL